MNVPMFSLRGSWERFQSFLKADYQSLKPRRFFLQLYNITIRKQPVSLSLPCCHKDSAEPRLLSSPPQPQSLKGKGTLCARACYHPTASTIINRVSEDICKWWMNEWTLNETMSDYAEAPHSHFTEQLTEVSAGNPSESPELTKTGLETKGSQGG